MIGVLIHWRLVRLRRRGYRDTGLDDRTAQDAMLTAINDVACTIGEARYRLLSVGFADDHPLCLELDMLWRDWSTRWEVQRRAYPELAGRPVAYTAPL
jgi:hypothetical protein